MKRLTNCKICKKKLHGQQKKYCSVICKNKALQSYEAQKKRGLKRKLEMIKARGNRCSICGYKKNLAALTFHHVNSDKQFKLDMRSLSNRTLDSVLKEVKKCILVCHNCHAELHNPRLNLANLSNEPSALTTELRTRM